MPPKSSAVATELESSGHTRAQITTQLKPALGLGDGFAIKYAVWFFADNPPAIGWEADPKLLLTREHL